MISSFGFQLIYVSERTSLSRIRAIVVKELNGTVYTVFFFTKSAVRFSRHAFFNSLIKQTLGPLDLPSMRGLYRTDGTRPDGVTMIPWEMGKQLMWDVTVVDALSPSRLLQGSLSNPETTVTEAEAGKIEMYRKLKDNGYIFQQGGLVSKQFG